MNDGINASPDKLSIAVFSGDFTRVHYALVMASGALAINRPVTVFFTMEASRALLAGDDIDQGWHGLAPPAPFETALACDTDLQSKGVGGFEELLEAGKDLGARVVVCEMGLRALGLDGQKLREDLSVEIAGVVTFLNDASGTGAVVFV